MDLDALRDKTIRHLALTYPQLAEGAERLVDECFASALRSVKPDFMGLLSPQAWTAMTILYVKNFLESGIDLSMGQIFAAVIRDSIALNRMDLLTQELAQKHHDETPQPHKPELRVVKE